MSGFVNYNNISIRLCVLGDGGVGKTSVTIQFVSNNFLNCYDPTIEDLYRKQYVIDDQVYMLDILDTAGQDELTPIRNHWIRSCESFILVYSITSRSSFDQIQFYRDLIVSLLDRDNVPIMMIGNKSDLEYERIVTYQEGKDLANRLGMSFMEVSAKNRSIIEEVFNETVRNSKKIGQKSKKGKSIGNKKSIIKKFNQKVNNTFNSIFRMI
ncbi:hypothetical protein RB653_006715 [Dictyostelium firmibasis]|uniref:Uncharacterized protein n=1 Tax=Dictyostelium firmibasis TaxID=79012 RepID=A0AAN7TKN3_9MYCE